MPGELVRESDPDDEPRCDGCGAPADMYAGGVWVCDACDDADDACPRCGERGCCEDTHHG